MNICPRCGYKYMFSVYEGPAHIFLRCPNEGCYKLSSVRKQAIRGKVVKRDGHIAEVNAYDGGF